MGITDGRDGVNITFKGFSRSGLGPDINTSSRHPNVALLAAIVGNILLDYCLAYHPYIRQRLVDIQLSQKG